MKDSYYDKLRKFGKENRNFNILPDNHSSGSLYQYYRFVKNYKELNPKEQIEYIIKYRENGDQYYKDAVILSNQKAVIAVVNRTCKHKSLYADFIQTANYGLCVAFDMYDPSYNVLFYTYAISRMLYEIYVLETTYFENKKPNKHIKKIIPCLIQYLNKQFENNNIPSWNDIKHNTNISNNMLRILKPIIESSINDYLYNHQFRITVDYINAYIERNNDAWLDTGVSQHFKDISINNTIDKQYAEIQNKNIQENIISLLHKHTTLSKTELENIELFLNNEQYDKQLLKESIKTIKKNKKLITYLKQKL